MGSSFGNLVSGLKTMGSTALKTPGQPGVNDGKPTGGWLGKGVASGIGDALKPQPITPETPVQPGPGAPQVDPGYFQPAQFQRPQNMMRSALYGG